jgi:hypothetical protein
MMSSSVSRPCMSPYSSTTRRSAGAWTGTRRAGP